MTRRYRRPVHSTYANEATVRVAAVSLPVQPQLSVMVAAIAVWAIAIAMLSWAVG